MGYETLESDLPKKVNYNLRFVLKEESNALSEVVIITGKQSKKTILPLIFFEIFGKNAELMASKNLTSTNIESTKK